VAPAQELGETPEGRRRIVPIMGGSVAGARLQGRILPGGADWQLIRSDGVAVLYARYTIEAADGALVAVVNRGYRHGPPEIMQRLVAGEAVDPAAYYFRTSPVFETGAAAHRWLTRTVFIGVGIRHPTRVDLEVFEVA